MSVKITAHYIGDNTVELEHGPTSNRIRTDLPVDNGGQGRTFSPTDLLAGALASCILTIMSMAAAKTGLDLKGARVEVEKEMQDKPRRVARFSGRITLPAHLNASQRERLKAYIHACPVGGSLHPEVKVDLDVV